MTKKAQKKMFIGYVRVSTREQGDDSKCSLREQKDKIIKYAKLYNLDLYPFFYEDIASGSEMEKRDGLQKALDLLDGWRHEEDNLCGGLIVAKLDRLSRNLNDTTSLMDEYFMSDYSLHSVSEQLDTSSSTGRMMINILGTFANFERERIAERTQDTMDWLKQNNRIRGQAPYGLKANPETNILEPNENERKVIRRIRRMRKKGLSFGLIAEELDAQGYRTRRESNFKPGSVHKIWNDNSTEDERILVTKIKKERRLKRCKQSPGTKEQKN